MTSARELRELTEDDLRNRSAIGRSALPVGIQKAMGHLDVPLKLRAVRRDLARVKTVLRQKTAPAGRS